MIGTALAARAALVVAGFAAAAAVVARRGRPVAPAPRLSVLERASLGRAGGLALVAADGRRLLVGYGEGPPRLVLELDLAARAAGERAGDGGAP
ncbi:MAG: flagellar biosynthetic protein FliO [Anaeromyxobacter sp.]